MEELMNTKDLLQEEVIREIRGLRDLEPGSDEHAKRVEKLTAIHKLYADELKEENAKNAKEDELMLKTHQAENAAKQAASDRKVEIAKLMVSGAGTLLCAALFVTNQLLGWGFESQGYVALGDTFKTGTREAMKNLTKMIK